MHRSSSFVPTIISMASIFVSAALALSLLLTLAAAQQNPGSFDIRAEEGWDNFVKDAAKGTGGTPADMNEFANRVNNNINDGGGDDADEASDPELIDELKNFDDSESSTTVKTESGKSKPPEPGSEPTAAAMDSLATARMIASANGGSVAPANAPTNGAFPVEVAGVVCGILPVIAACFVL